MAFLGWAFVLAQILGQGIDDIKVGNCLTFPEIQNMAGTERSDIYLGGDCETQYEVDGALSEKLSCGDLPGTGEWHRSMVQHDKPGVYFFSRPPCRKSVQYLSYESTAFSDIPAGEVCTKENSKVAHYRQEKLATKRFDVAQGQVYLPDPLWVHREDFGVSDAGEYARLHCEESEVRADYLGWGVFHVRWSEHNCGEEKLLKCREAKISASENEHGEACGRVDEFTDCLPAHPN
jgi:hypothetical protein